LRSTSGSTAGAGHELLPNAGVDGDGGRGLVGLGTDRPDSDRSRLLGRRQRPRVVHRRRTGNLTAATIRAEGSQRSIRGLMRRRSRLAKSAVSARARTPMRPRATVGGEPLVADEDRSDRSGKRPAPGRVGLRPEDELLEQLQQSRAKRRGTAAFCDILRIGERRAGRRAHQNGEAPVSQPEPPVYSRGSESPVSVLMLCDHEIPTEAGANKESDRLKVRGGFGRLIQA